MLSVLPSYLSQIQERPEDSLPHQERQIKVVEQTKLNTLSNSQVVSILWDLLVFITS